MYQQFQLSITNLSFLFSLISSFGFSLHPPSSDFKLLHLLRDHIWLRSQSRHQVGSYVIDGPSHRRNMITYFSSFIYLITIPPHTFALSFLPFDSSLSGVKRFVSCSPCVVILRLSSLFCTLRILQPHTSLRHRTSYPSILPPLFDNLSSLYRALRTMCFIVLLSLGLNGKSSKTHKNFYCDEQHIY